MLQIFFAWLLLSLTLGLSVRRFIVPYVAAHTQEQSVTPVDIVANALFLGALALAVSDKGPLSAGATLAGSVLLALLIGQRWPGLSLLLSAGCFLAYLNLR